MKTDEELLASWRAGDLSAGDALFARYFDEIFDFFDRKITGDVSDLVQRTFLGCVQGIDRFRDDCSLRTYLYAIARNELYGYFRRRKREDELDFGVSSLRDLGPSPSSALGRGELTADLARALVALPLDLQILVELRYWGGLTAPEAAEVLGIPDGTAASRLRRAITLLRKQLAADRAPVPDGLRDDASFERWARSLRPYRGDRGSQPPAP